MYVMRLHIWQGVRIPALYIDSLQKNTENYTHES